jgi:hypothetical protein
VRPLIEKHLGPLETDVEVDEPKVEVATPGDTPSEPPPVSRQTDLFGNDVVGTNSRKGKSRKRRK